MLNWLIKSCGAGTPTKGPVFTSMTEEHSIRWEERGICGLAVHCNIFFSNRHFRSHESVTHLVCMQDFLGPSLFTGRFLLSEISRNASYWQSSMRNPRYMSKANFR